MTDSNAQEQTGWACGTVGLGASAGGLEALISFFKAMPTDSGLVFIVVQHLSPDRKSAMPDLLAHHTSMNIFPAEHGMRVMPDCIYLQPPQTNMTLFKGALLLDKVTGQPKPHLPIDFFFRSLAEDQKAQAVAIVLSGTGSDGSRGIAAVRQGGGMVLVQTPAEAGFDGMPQSAAATGLADWICPAAEMPKRLQDYLRHPRLRRQAEASAGEEADMTRIIALLRSRTNIDFSLYKPVTISRRISRRMALSRCPALHDYVELLQMQPYEADLLQRDLLIGVTRFFRDHKEFDYLRENIIPQIFDSAAEQEEIRVWDAGCSTGEEAYTVAMLLHDYMTRKRKGRRWKIKVFATDLDQHAIAKAARGFYSEGIAADLPQDILERYFRKTENGFIVRRHIREMVLFAQQNLLQDSPFTRLDMAVCRNLLIYLQPAVQQEVLALFHFAVKEGGFLFLGSSETVTEDMADNFLAVNRHIRIYRHAGKGLPPPNRNLRLAQFPTSLPLRQPEADAVRQRMDLAQRLELREAHYQRIVGRMAAACLLVSREGEIIESFGRTELLLQPQPGKMNLHLSAMLTPTLLLPVCTAMRACQHEVKGEMVYDNIKISETSSIRWLLRAVFLPEERLYPASILVALEQMPGRSERAGPKNSQHEEEVNRQLLDLKREVQFTRESLEAANEALQTSNEELQAANEALLASNEELQSANEELNSLNEELSTVNAEYQSKIAEMSELYNDLDNLFCSTDIGFIFVDRELRIRKYTPSVVKVINLMRQDLGRRISDMAAPLLGDIEAELASLLLTRKKKERVVRHKEEFWYLVQFIPYIDETNEVSGMVISIVDVSEQKRAEEALRQSSEVLEQILAASPAPTMMVTTEGDIRFANEMAAIMFTRPAEELVGLPLSSEHFLFTDLEGRAFAEAQDFVRAAAEAKEALIIRLQGRESRQEYFLTVKANKLTAQNSRLNGVVLTFSEIARQN
ncbi:Two-component system, chemotaxis family, CheB/CheR fusion protein [Candidatus Electronema halotolerans]